MNYLSDELKGLEKKFVVFYFDYYLVYLLFAIFLNLFYQNYGIAFVQFNLCILFLIIKNMLRVSTNLNYKVFYKKSVYYIMLLYFVTTVIFWDQFPTVIGYHFSAFVGLSFVFKIKKSLIILGITMLSIPVNYIMNYYQPDLFLLKKTEMYSLLFNLHNLFFSFTFFMYLIYYQYHIIKLKTVIQFVENEEVEIESFYLVKNNSIIKKDDLPQTIGNASNIEKLFNEIKIHMIKKKPWINPEYTLEQLARDVNSNTQYVSAAINIYTKNNFKTYINEFRVQAFINTVGDIKSKKTSIKEVYLNVGFNSQSTFNRVFKQSQNISPTDFVQNHLLNS